MKEERLKEIRKSAKEYCMLSLREHLNMIDELVDEVESLQQQNESLQEALKKIAEYPTIITTSTERYSNAVSIAKKALKGAMTYE